MTMRAVAQTTLGRMRRLIDRRRWYEDLVEYYGVTPAQAEALGIRKSGRRPNLPGSATTAAVRGLTYEEIWQMRARSGPEAIQQFYQDMGAWATFRQVYRHRYLDASRYLRGLPAGARFCEYGSGVAPVSHWMVEHVRRPMSLTITDVPCEHFRFGRWRLEKKIAVARVKFSLTALEVTGDYLPLTETYDAILISEVFEHLHNSLAVARHLVEHLKPGGRLWENYLVKAPEAADLKEAQEQRGAVFEHLRATCVLSSGGDPDQSPSDTRRWIKR